VARADEVRMIAYNLWEREGCVNGKDCEHWFRAEAIWKDQQKPETTVASVKFQSKQVAPKAKKPITWKR
jgi:hypothetical protein